MKRSLKLELVRDGENFFWEDVVLSRAEEQFLDEHTANGGTFADEVKAMLDFDAPPVGFRRRLVGFPNIFLSVKGAVRLLTTAKLLHGEEYMARLLDELAHWNDDFARGTAPEENHVKLLVGYMTGALHKLERPYVLNEETRRKISENLKWLDEHASPSRIKRP